MTNYVKESNLKKVGSTLAIIGIVLLTSVLFVWAIVRPYGKTKSEVSEDFWNLKVKMAQKYAENTGDGYFVAHPEDVVLLRNEDGSYWAFYPGSMLNSKSGESYKIVDEDDKQVIDNEID